MKFLIILLFSLFLFAEDKLPQTNNTIKQSPLEMMREDYPQFKELDDTNLVKEVRKLVAPDADETKFLNHFGVGGHKNTQNTYVENKKTDSTLVAVFVTVLIFLLIVLFLLIFKYIFPNSKHWKVLNMTQGFIFGFIFIVGLEIFALMFINYISNSTFAPRGLGWIVLPFIFAFYASNQIKNDEDVFDFKFSFPSIKLFPQTKKGFRVGIIFSMLWIIGSFLITTAGHIGRWKHNDEYLFIFAGVFPIVLYWSFYWIKSAKD